MSTMETPPPPDASVPPARPERRCPRCGSTLAADQEWCLSCGAAAGTEVVEARGWRVPLYLGGGLAALAVLGVILAIIALASRKEEVAQNPPPQPTPSVAAPPATSPTATATVAPLETSTPAPTTSPQASPTTTPGATPSPGATTTPSPSATPSPTTSATGTFPGWTGGDGYTIIIESNKTQAGAEKVAKQAQDKGQSGVGILNSSDYSSLNGGYYVVFVGTYTSKSEAESALDGVRADFSDAYVRRIKQ